MTIILAFSAIDQSWIKPGPPALSGPPAWFAALVIAFTAAMVFLSYWPARNMLSSHQRMNMSFNPFHLANTYGAFGSIGRIRREVVIEGTDEPELTKQTVWQEYEFKGKPGAVRRLPRQWAPYHLRLDWLMWFAAISPAYAQPWLTPFLQRLLRNDLADAAPVAAQSLSGIAAPVCARAALRIPLHHAGRTAAGSGMVASHVGGWVRPAHDATEIGEAFMSSS